MSMTPDSVLGLGTVAVAVGLVVLFLLQLELGNFSGVGRLRRWLLVGAMGSGVAAFAIKLLMIVVLANKLEPSREIPAPVHAEVHTRETPSSSKPSPRYRWLELSTGKSLTAGIGSYRWEALPEVAPVPANCAKVTLGERLFFDPRLSRDGTISCASCHDVRHGAGHDGLATAVGIDAQVGKRNTPTVWNSAFQARLFWDGRAASLEEQAMGPLINPAEMGMPSLEAVVERVAAEPEYRLAFEQAFGADKHITIERIAEAIAAFERTLITPDSPYDRFVRGELSALTAAQLRGMALFESVGCINCHHGPNFSAASRFDSRAPYRIFPALATPFEERYRLTEDHGASGVSGRGVWRVPSLRNVALTAPYFHNGSVTELKEAVRIMATVQLGRVGHMLVWSDRGKRLEMREGSALTEQELDDIVAFLHALSSDRLVSLQKQRGVYHTKALGYALSKGDDVAVENGCS